MIPIIGFSGRAGAGKSLASDLLSEEFALHPLAFADPLRAMVLPAVMVATKSDKKAAINFLYEKKDEVIPGINTTARQLYRDFGDAMRSHDPDVFITLTERKMEMITEHYANQAHILSDQPPPKDAIVPFVIDDVRYNNEAEFIKSKGGMIVNIVRPDDNLRKVPAHSSENGVSKKYINLEIDNDKSIQEFKETVFSVAALYDIPKFSDYHEQTHTDILRVH